MNLRCLSALALLASAAAAQDYFPLQVGNEWVYRAASPARGLSLAVSESKVINGNTYYRLTGFNGGSYWVRNTDTGTLVAFDEDLQRDRLWYNFSATPGSSYETALPGSRATIVSNSARFDGPLGQLNNALEVGYSGSAREQFLPSIGLAFRQEGGVRQDLVYARVRGANVFSATEVSFRMTLTAAELQQGQRLGVRLTLVAGEPVRITFPSTQRFDLQIRNSAGQIVYTWSADKAFAQVISTQEFTGETHWLVNVPVNGLPAGAYTVEGWLAPDNPTPVWRASSGFRVSP